MPLPLDLFGEVATPSGSFKWNANEPRGFRPQNLSFRTKLGEGFSDASCNLSRRIDLDYPDLQLVNSVVFTGADGSVAYEGRIQGMPREVGETHSIGVTMAGWMAHAKDEEFTEIYVDRDLGAWTGMSRARRASLLAGNYMPKDPSQPQDVANSEAAVGLTIDGAWVSPYIPIAEAWYDAGANCLVRFVEFKWTRTATVAAVAPWVWDVVVSSDDVQTATDSSGNLMAAGPDQQRFTSPTARRHARIAFYYNATGAGSDGVQFETHWTKIAVHGDHELQDYGYAPGEPSGYYASDVIRDIAQRFCPMLDVNGVQATTYPIPHLVFKDFTAPYDAFLHVNKYHLWHLGVWDNRTLHFRPYDLTDHQWEVRVDEGAAFSPQGPSTDDLFNGIIVTYTELVSGVKNILHPRVYSDLRDLSPENPWNQRGIARYAKLDLSTPTLADQALQIGRASLVERNRPKAPGTITVRGYVKDRQGNLQPGWKVRAGDMVAITDHPNDSPRLIHETSWDDTTKALTISVDGPAQAMDALFDRLSTALEARGLA